MNNYSDEIIQSIAQRAIDISKGSMLEIDKYCWMAVHEYRHSVMPSEYDIREIDEYLYDLVMKEAKSRF